MSVIGSSSRRPAVGRRDCRGTYCSTMPSAQINDDIRLEYDTFGSPEDPALLLVMGFMAQMTAWRDAFCKLLADRGLFVIRYDNRDCGLSTKFDGVQVD